MYCPHCKYEYRDDIFICPDCKMKLVKEPEKSFDRIEAMKPVKVASVSNFVEAELILDLLRNNGIQCFKKDNGAGSYMNIYYGMSVFGEEIYVDEHDCLKAEELIKELSVPNHMPIDAQEVESKAEEDDFINPRDIKDDSYENYPFYRNPHKIARIILIVSIITTFLCYVSGRFQ